MHRRDRTSQVAKADLPPPAAPHRLATPEEPSPLLRFFVLFVIAFSSVATLAMVGWMYYRWAKTIEPSSAIVVEGDPSVDGATILVTGDGETSISAKLTAENKYTTPILLSPGTYILTITRDGHTLLKRDFVLEEREGRKWYIGEKAKEPVSALPS